MSRDSKETVIILIVMFNFILGCVSRNDKLNDQKQTKTKTTINQTPINWIGTWMDRESKRKLVQHTTREFEILNQDIKVNLKFQEEFCNNCKNFRGVVQDTILNMIRSGKYNWDIITLTQRFYQEIGNSLNDPEWGKKYLVNFADFEWFRERHKPIIFDVKQYLDDLGGIFAGPIIEGRYYSLWYNSRITKKIGFQIKQIGMTFDDFLGYVKQVYEYNQKTTDKIQIFADKGSANPTPELFNALLLSALGTDNLSKIDTPKSLEALKKAIKALEKLAIYKPLDLTINSSASAEPSLDGKVLFGSYVSSIINQWEANNKEESQNMIPAEFPVFEKPGMYYHGSYQSVWAVFKDAPHRNEAVKLMQYFCSNDFAEKWISNIRNPTALKVRLNATDIAQDEIARFNNSIEKKYGTNIRNYDIAQILFGLQTKIALDATALIKGEITADEYYNMIVKQLKKK